MSTQHTLIHVTHEAVEHIGGIGTVLAGLLTSKRYLQRVGRSILVGPLPYPDRATSAPVDRLGSYAKTCYYSGIDSYDPHGFGAILKPIEWAFGTRIVFGQRVFHAPGDESITAVADLLLIDVSNPNRERLSEFKWWLSQNHNIDSQRYENSWDYEEYCRLASPAYHALSAVLEKQAGGGEGGKSDQPAVVVAHEFMGLATGLRCVADRKRFRAVFHAHECSTARRLAENHPAMDIAFYRAMDQALAQNKCVGEVFSDQSDYGRHALVERSFVLDGILAVGPQTADELGFLSPPMRQAERRVVYNGLPAKPVTFDQRTKSRELVNKFWHNLLGFTPDYVFTHVTRPVPSKGLWRDVTVCDKIEPMLRARGKRAVYLLLTCGAATRSSAQVEDMYARYRWPLAHQPNWPDLVGPEVDLYHAIESMNVRLDAHARQAQKDGKPSVRGLFVNQFGFSRQNLGPAAPEGLTTEDLRRAADVEFGMSTYEPFGIAQLEPLHAGAICVPSTVCGCLGLVQRAMKSLKIQSCPLILPADFVSSASGGSSPGATSGSASSSPLAMTELDRLTIEEKVCQQIAEQLVARLPTTVAQSREYLELGQRLSALMSWDAVVESDFMPAIEACLTRQ